MLSNMKKVFPSRLRALRGAKTTRAAAELCGVTQPAWTMWENGRREPSFDLLLKICVTFHVSADYLLGLSDVATAPPRKHELKVAEPPPLDYMA